jgi:hypothetical protein
MRETNTLGFMMVSPVCLLVTALRISAAEWICPNHHSTIERVFAVHVALGHIAPERSSTLEVPGALCADLSNIASVQI